MTIAELQEQIVQIRTTGLSQGLTDREIGALEICELHPDKKSMIPVGMKLEFSKLKTRSNRVGEFFIHYEKKFIGLLKAIN